MRSSFEFSRRVSLAVLAVVTACADSTGPDASQSLSASRTRGDDAGGVYTMTNDAQSNAIVAFRRAGDGSLSPAGTTATGGRGIGGAIDPLASQYSIVISRGEHPLLFAVNAGSNDISSFRIAGDASLRPADRASSGGTKPVSLAVHHRLLYVLNAGDNTLSGFRAAESGRLLPLPAGHASLAPGTTLAAAIRFTVDGRYLIVSERGSQSLEVFPVERDGRLGAGWVTHSHGAGTFGFDVTPGNKVIVSEAAGAAPNGAVSSYDLSRNALRTITASLDVGARATCWLIATTDGQYAFTANAASATVTGFRIASDGALSANGGVSTGAGSTPLDLDVAGDNHLVYVLLGGNGNVGAFAVGRDGGLTSLGQVHAGGAAAGLQGLASF
jgi:6-phosphogluconolactonase (cycloisomerase 2 family)